MIKYTLAKDERLKSRKSIDLLFKEGRFLSIFPVKLAYIIHDCPEGEKSSLFSVSVSKRNYKRAVDRNKIKRLFREAYRLNCIPIKEKMLENNKQIMLMFIYGGRKMPPYQDIEKTVIALNEMLLKKLK